MNMKKEDKARSFLLLLVAMGVVFLGITIYSIGRDENIKTSSQYALNTKTITEKEAYEIATKQKGLQPGDPQNKADWLIGYHYDIKLLTLIQDEDNRRLAITVHGISKTAILRA